MLWLCSPGASYVVCVALPVDGGYTAQWTHQPSPAERPARWISSTAPTVGAMHTQPSSILATQKGAVHATKDTPSDRR